MAEAVLVLESLAAGYSDTVVLENVTLRVRRGESISIIGRNGVGKTTLLATIMGHTALHDGRILLDERDISAAPIHHRARAGLGYVPQEREIFPSLTVSENLQVGARAGAWNQDRVFELFPRLAARRSSRGSQLSGGEQQMLAIGRALVGNPSVLLLDEPSEGLAPVVVETLLNALAQLRDSASLALILVEQNTRIALAFSARTIIMDRGRITFDGASAELKADEERLSRLIGVSAR